MKTHKIIIADTADECLFNIAYYIALDNPIRSDSRFVHFLVSSEDWCCLLKNNEKMPVF